MIKTTATKAAPAPASIAGLLYHGLGVESTGFAAT